MFFLKKIFWIARNTFTEAARQKFFSFLLLLGAGLTAVSLSLTHFDFGDSELKFIADFGFGGIFLFGSVLAVVTTVQLFFTEIENRTALTMLAKPVRRGEFLFGKFLGVWCLLGVFVVLMCGVLAAVLALRAGTLAEISEARSLPPPFVDFVGLAIFGVLQWVRLGIVAAMTIAVSSFAQTYLYAVVVSFVALIIAQLQYVFADFASGEKVSFGVKALAGTATKLIPNLQLFNTGEALVLDPAGLSAATIMSALGYGTIWIAALVFVGMWFFRFREI